MVSLIVATLNRTIELERLLTSLANQSCRDFEVIIVDQNDDDRVPLTLRNYKELKILYLRSERGLSLARNLALQHVSGEIFAIPDDDCWYPPELLHAVAGWFREHADFSILSVIKRSADNQPVGPKWPATAREVTKGNVWECAISSTIFVRRAVKDTIAPFDDLIGVGSRSRYQSGEETDYLLRALGKGFRIWYDPSMTVHHPPLVQMERLLRTTYPFALGAGYVMRVHGYSLVFLAGGLIRSAGGAVVNACRGDLALSRIYVLRGLGLCQGYFYGRRELARLRGQTD